MWRSPRLWRGRPVSVSRQRRDGRLKVMNFKVYVIYSVKLERYYTGYTNNIEKRLVTHNQGGKKYTTKGIPWKLIKTYNCNSVSEALILERKIKKRGIKRFLAEN
jgi:putative endonuclease